MNTVSMLKSVFGPQCARTALCLVICFPNCWRSILKSSHWTFLIQNLVQKTALRSVIQVHIQVGPILQIRCLYVNRMVLWRRAGQLLTGKKMQNNNNKAIFGLVLHNTCRTLVLLHSSTASRDMRPPGTTAVKPSQCRTYCSKRQKSWK